MAKEDVKIYRQEQRPTETLPSYLALTRDGLVVTGAAEGNPGPYGAVYDFGLSQQDLRARVPVKERIWQNSKTLIFTELERPAITVAMRNITEINRNRLPNDDEARFEYQQQLFEVFDLMKPFIQSRVTDRTVFFPPKNGAKLVEAFFQELAIIDEQTPVVDYELKRVLMEDERLMVGVVDGSYPEGPFDSACFIDDCMAANVSLQTSADLIRSHYPEVENLTVVVSAASQRGMQGLDRKLSEGFDFNHALLAGTGVFEMSSNYYLLRTREEGFPARTQSVGDMGRWAKPLPSAFNDRAPWNVFR